METAAVAFVIYIRMDFINLVYPSVMNTTNYLLFLVLERGPSVSVLMYSRSLSGKTVQADFLCFCLVL